MAGCLEENTLITLIGETKRKIKDLKVGDEIISFNEEGKFFEKDIIKRHFATGSKKGFKITLENGSEIVASSEHLFLTKDGWKETCQLTEKDNIISINDVPFEKSHI